MGSLFEAHVLEPAADADGGKSGSAADKEAAAGSDFSGLLPATYRTEEDDIAVISQVDLAFLEREFLVRRLNSVHKHMWLAGRPMPPRPLHHQIMLRRNIVVTEDMELHLVWYKTRIFIKPVPTYLLDPAFWASQRLDRGPADGDGDGDAKRRREVAACARGFLFTYTALIAYPSDFRIAKERGLIPDGLTWEDWRQKAADLVGSHSYEAVNWRFWYGELRLSRLNKIYRLTLRSPLRGYSLVSGHAALGDLVSDNFALLGSLLAYMAIVLTAMQVGLATTQLQPSPTFQSASYGFTVFSIVAPLIGAFVILVCVLVLIGSNVAATKQYERKRFEGMGVEHRVRRRTATTAESMAS